MSSIQRFDADPSFLFVYVRWFLDFTKNTGHVSGIKDMKKMGHLDRIQNPIHQRWGLDGGSQDAQQTPHHRHPINTATKTHRQHMPNRCLHPNKQNQSTTNTGRERDLLIYC
jgi:hypothetical protein